MGITLCKQQDNIELNIPAKEWTEFSLDYEQVQEDYDTLTSIYFSKWMTAGDPAVTMTLVAPPGLEPGRLTAEDSESAARWPGRCETRKKQRKTGRRWAAVCCGLRAA